ncbi:MAG: hypothetical protein J6J33_04495, partial [Clostridia bacterium]|nr:hypothetical protein [Clostridia bacterium]
CQWHYYYVDSTGKVYRTTEPIVNAISTTEGFAKIFAQANTTSVKYENVNSYNVPVVVSNLSYSALSNLITFVPDGSAPGDPTYTFAKINQLSKSVQVYDVMGTNKKEELTAAPATTYVYDHLTGRYFFLNGTYLYNEGTYLENEAKYTFSDSAIELSFNYFYHAASYKFEFRPTANYFLFPSYKIVGISNDDTASGGTANFYPINQRAYAVNTFTNQALRQMKVTNSRTTSYYADPGHSMPLNVKVDTRYENLGNSSHYALVNGKPITILGKYTIANDTGNIKTYDSYSSIIPVTNDEPLKDEKTYYEVDYTSKDNVKEGFPGVTLVDGSPYINPIFVFNVSHRPGTPALINLALKTNNGFYVELLSSIVENKDSDIITDFTSVTFKATLANLQMNDYIDNMYYIVDRRFYKPLMGYEKLELSDVPEESKLALVSFVEYYHNYLGKTTEKTPYMLFADYIELTQDEKSQYLGLIKVGDSYYKAHAYILKISDVATNKDATDSNIFYNSATKIDENGNEVYFKNVYGLVNGEFKALTDEDVAIWKSDTAQLNDVPYYDIHTYYQDPNTGIIYLTSDIVGDNSSEECIGLDGLELGATSSTSADIDYENVVVGGITSAYKVNSEDLKAGTSYFQGYWLEKAIPIKNNSDTSSVYLNCG